MQSISLDVQPRETGKKAVKATRNAGLVPCVLYGSHTDPVHFAVDTLQLRPLIFTTETYRVAFGVDGADHEAIVKEIAYHPVTDQPLHVDFLALTPGEALTMVVPIRLEGSPRGVKAGGVLSQSLNELEIRALPRDIPGHVSVDITSLEIGESVHVEQIAVGDAVEVLTDRQRTIAAVTAPRALVEETEDEVLELAEGDVLADAEGLELAEGDEAPVVEGDEA